MVFHKHGQQRGGHVVPCAVGIFKVRAFAAVDVFVHCPVGGNEHDTHVLHRRVTVVGRVIVQQSVACHVVVGRVEGRRLREVPLHEYGVGYQRVACVAAVIQLVYGLCLPAAVERGREPLH